VSFHGYIELHIVTITCARTEPLAREYYRLLQTGITTQQAVQSPHSLLGTRGGRCRRVRLVRLSQLVARLRLVVNGDALGVGHHWPSSWSARFWSARFLGSASSASCFATSSASQARPWARRCSAYTLGSSPSTA
jgi:hypothetical protein